MRITFTLNGVTRTLSSEEVEAALADQEPERIFDYAVAVRGRWYPPKQALVRPLGLTNRDVNSRTAFGYLKRLGFASHDQRSDGPLPQAPGIPTHAVSDTEVRERCLRLSCDLLAATGASASDATKAAEHFLNWLATA